MRRLEDVPRGELKDYLGKGWLTHDAMWFYHTCRDSGIQEANRLNREAIRSLAAIEMARARKVLCVEEGELRTWEGLAQFMQDALAMTLPSSIYSRVSFTLVPPNVLHWEWADGECFAYQGMKQLGVIDEYVCGVMFRIECWLENSGIPYTLEPRIEGCIMHRTGHCAGDFTVLI
ncbi:MAG: hypothetical protein KKF41_06300 [Actinobacteria bacterium]|nr:hypothetical protein [Actinomycetota bacterium]MBU1942053.1 hypothetical protein [Actinomycetota bacterium]MBU2687176.1 hypothetical protein [Actinomycetota bacterium]